MKTPKLNPLLTKQHLKAVIFKSYILYVQKFYPDVKIEKICEQAGLPLDYLLVEENWVSITFERDFMAALQAQITDPLLIAKVGAFGVDADVVGRAIHFMCRNLLTLQTVYQKLPFVTSLLNKVVRLRIVNQFGLQITYEVTPILTGLTKHEKTILIDRMPAFVESLKGYYEAIPSTKNLRSAEVQVIREEIDGAPSYMLHVSPPRELDFFSNWSDYAIAGVAPTLTAIAASQMGLNGLAVLLSSITVFSSVVSIFLFKKLRLTRNVESETAESLQKLDNQYKILHTTQSELNRKLGESDAITQIVSQLAHADSRAEVLDFACQALATNLGYDRSVVFLSSPDEQTLQFEAGYGLTDDFLHALRQVRLDVMIESEDPRKISNVFRTGQPILIEDVKEHLPTLQDESSRQLLRFSGATTFAAVPIRGQQKTYGVLMVDCYHSAKVLSSIDTEILMTVATQMAIGIEKSNARLALSTALFRTEELSGSYSRFVPFETLKQAGYNTVFDVKIGDGVEKQRTILFSDIRDFTQLCETMSPSDVLKFLNSYFGSLSPIIKKHNGIVDKFIGDCVMAIFIDPLDAMNAAIEMQRHLIHYNLERRTNGRKPVYAGIGICQGSVLMGPVGFDGKIEITVVSDVVNTASRLDGLSKELEAKILVTGIAPEILERLDEDVLSVEHGQKSVKGKTQFVEVTELLDQKLLDLFDSIERTEEVARFQEEYISLFVKKINLAKKRTRNQALQ